MVRGMMTTAGNTDESDRKRSKILWIWARTAHTPRFYGHGPRKAAMSFLFCFFAAKKAGIQPGLFFFAYMGGKVMVTVVPLP